MKRKINEWVVEHGVKLVIGGICYAILYATYQMVFVIPAIQAKVDNIKTEDIAEIKQDVREVKADIKELLRRDK
jgi:hypothetical protein